MCSGVLLQMLSSLKHFILFILGLIRMFGLETIVIYSVLLLKKKIIIYHHSLPSLLEVSVLL